MTDKRTLDDALHVVPAGGRLLLDLKVESAGFLAALRKDTP
ncbi:MAG: hypothetical protein O2923_00545 [Verrucomicrobia bacterium]|nr:hypothetical protein [Verrucomicrobiota bacterium]MDA1086028.1 hypothetical protein [Verrucomicrobiota bacterium]